MEDHGFIDTEKKWINFVSKFMTVAVIFICTVPEGLQIAVTISSAAYRTKTVEERR